MAGQSQKPCVPVSEPTLMQISQRFEDTFTCTQMAVFLGLPNAASIVSILRSSNPFVSPPEIAFSVLKMWKEKKRLNKGGAGKDLYRVLQHDLHFTNLAEDFEDVLCNGPPSGTQETGDVPQTLEPPFAAAPSGRREDKVLTEDDMRNLSEMDCVNRYDDLARCLPNRSKGAGRAFPEAKITTSKSKENDPVERFIALLVAWTNMSEKHDIDEFHSAMRRANMEGISSSYFGGRLAP